MFFDLNEKTCRIRRVFEQLSSSIGWEVMTEQSQSYYSGFAVLKWFRVKFRNLYQKRYCLFWQTCTLLAGFSPSIIRHAL